MIPWQPTYYTSTTTTPYCVHSSLYRVRVDQHWVLVIALGDGSAVECVNKALGRTDITLAVPYAMEGTYLVPETWDWDEDSPPETLNETDAVREKRQQIQDDYRLRHFDWNS